MDSGEEYRTRGRRGPAALRAIQGAVLQWFDEHGRDLPWRRTRDPYAILVAETMLQQTQVERVVPRYTRFLERFPTLAALAGAGTAEVLREWSGLGYNGRALRLQAAARAVVERHGGRMPRDEADVRALPGVGPYTAAAIRCFAFEADAPLVDTNHRRVLGRLLVGLAPERMPREAAFRRLAAEALPSGRGWAWNQALMDLGAMVCTARAPACDACPAERWCLSAGRGVAEAPASYVLRRQGRFDGSRRQLRGWVVRELLRAGRPLPLPELRARCPAADAEFAAVLEALERDGLVVLDGEVVRLP